MQRTHTLATAPDWRADTYARLHAAAVDAARMARVSVDHATDHALTIATDAIEAGDALTGADALALARMVAAHIKREQRADDHVTAAMSDVRGVRLDQRRVTPVTRDSVATLADAQACQHAQTLSAGAFDAADAVSVAHARAVLAAWAGADVRTVRGVRGPVTTCDPDAYAARVLAAPFTAADAHPHAFSPYARALAALALRVATADALARCGRVDPDATYAATVHAAHARTLERFDRKRATVARVTASTGATFEERTDPYRVTRERTRLVLAAIADVLACLPHADGWRTYDPDPDAPDAQRVSVLALAGVPRHVSATVTRTHTAPGAWSPVAADARGPVNAHGSTVKRRGQPSRRAWQLLRVEQRDPAGRLTYVPPAPGRGIVRGVRYRESAATVGAFTLAESHRPDVYAENRERADALAFAVNARTPRKRGRGRPVFDALATLDAYARTLALAGIGDPDALALTLTADPDAPDPYGTRRTLTAADVLTHADAVCVVDRRGRVLRRDNVNATALADALTASGWPVTARVLRAALDSWADGCRERATRSGWNRTRAAHVTASRRLRALARVNASGARMLDPFTLTAHAWHTAADAHTRTHPLTFTGRALTGATVRRFDPDAPDTPRRVFVLAGAPVRTRATGAIVTAYARGAALEHPTHAPATVRVPRRVALALATGERGTLAGALYGCDTPDAIAWQAWSRGKRAHAIGNRADALAALAHAARVLAE